MISKPKLRSILADMFVWSDELNTLNIKLFPIYPAPPHVKAWEVPLFTVRYSTFMDENWDLTMQRVGLSTISSTIERYKADRKHRSSLISMA